MSFDSTVVNGLISDQFLWLLSAEEAPDPDRLNQSTFTSGVTIEKRSLTDGGLISETQIESTERSEFAGDFRLLETHRPDCLCLVHPEWGAELLTFNSGGEIVSQSSIPLPSSEGYFRDRLFFAPHGGEMIYFNTGSHNIVQRYLFPFSQPAQGDFEVEGHKEQTGCYLDDVHFLTNSRDNHLCIIHTRSGELISNFEVAGNTRWYLVAADKIGRYLHFGFSAVPYPQTCQRYVVHEDEFYQYL